MIVYALTDEGDRFVMFKTFDEKFAHSNARRTAKFYEQRIVSYEVLNRTFDIQTGETLD